jgi:ComF family protein
MELLARAVSRLLDVLAPPGCAACDAPCTTTFCEACGVVGADTQVHELDGAFGRVPLVVAGEYAAPLSTAITRFKYEGRPELARILAPLLVGRIQQLGPPADAVLVPVPLHPRRLATRGYNQAAVLAQELAGRCRWSCEPRLLRRARETERQVGKSRSLRLTNARGAFEQRRPGPARVVLVDDVVTTGSTVRACAQALADGGATLVAVAALALARQSLG